MKRMRDGSYTIKPTYTVGDHEIVPDMLARRAAAQPGPVGHTLVEHDSYGPRTVAFVHQPPGPQADIVLRRTIDRQPQLHEFGFDRRLDLQPVVQLPHRHHYRRHVVESVGPTAKHVQPDIDLAVGS